MNINVREATEEDIPTVLDLIKEFADCLGKVSNEKTSLEDFKRGKNLFHCLLAKTDDGDIVGYVLFCFTFDTWTGKTIYLDDLYVKNEYRRCSVGKKLVHTLIDFAKENGCKAIRSVVVNWDERAVEFMIR